MSPFIHPAFWSDPEIEAAPAEIKLAVLWLITNSQTSIIGLCRATEKRFAFETGLDAGKLKEACEKLPKMLLLAAGEGIWIRNYIHHQFGRGAKLVRNNCFGALRAAFNQVRSNALRQEIETQYEEFLDTKEPAIQPSDSPSQALGRGKVREEKGKDSEGKSFEEGGLGETEPPADRRAALTALSRRVGLIMRRKAETSWTEKEKRALAALYPIPDEQIVAVEQYYTANWPPNRDQNILRHDLLTLLNNWPGEVDRALQRSTAKGRASPAVVAVDPSLWTAFLKSQGINNAAALPPDETAIPPSLATDWKTFKRSQLAL